MELKKGKLKKKIVDEQLGLKDALNRGQELLVLHLLREWVYKKTNIASIPTISELELPVWKVHLNDVVLTTELYQQNIIGTTCGETNKYLSQIYKLFGFKSTVYNFGYLEYSLTHVVAFVECISEDAVIVQDAFLNGFLSLDGNIFNIFDLSLLNRWQDIEFVKGKNTIKYEIFNSEDDKHKKKVRKVEFGWDELVSFFEKNCLKNGIARQPFFNLLQYPINYRPMGVTQEKGFLNLLLDLSIKNKTDYHILLQKGIIENDSQEANILYAVNELVQNCTKKLSRVVIYGISGIGYTIYRTLLDLNVNVIAIIDGDPQKANLMIDKLKIEHYDSIVAMDPSLIIICSYTHAQIMKNNIFSLIDQKTQIILLDELLDSV